MTTEMPFDEVLLRLPAGLRRLTAGEFLQLPLSERIAHVLTRTATFLLRGSEVDRHAALAQMRVARATG